jgi:hypothetical protein
MQTVRYVQTYEDDITYYERYFSVILSFVGIRMTPLAISILAHAALFERLDKEIKLKIADRNQTNLQVVANNISKLRKTKHLEGSTVTTKQLPPKGVPFSLNLILNVKKEANIEG